MFDITKIVEKQVLQDWITLKVCFYPISKKGPVFTPTPLDTGLIQT